MDFLVNGNNTARWKIILAHGSGQGRDSAFMHTMAESLAAGGNEIGGIQAFRFDFPFMVKAKATGKRRPPDREPVLLQSWRDAIASVIGTGADKSNVIIGGKSLGGRMASLIVENEAVAGLVCLGYPFHPPGKPDRLRTEHLITLATPTLICQGERDTFGNKQEVYEYQLSKMIQYCWLPDGDHGFKPRKSSGYSESENLQSAATAIISFLNQLE